MTALACGILRALVLAGYVVRVRFRGNRDLLIAPPFASIRLHPRQEN